MADENRIKAPFKELRRGMYRYYAPGSNDPVLVTIEKDKGDVFVRFKEGYYPTLIKDIHVEGTFAKFEADGDIVKFKDLWVGDRFQRLDAARSPYKGEVWTKLDGTGARRHAPEETRWGGKSYGYVGSASCSFEADDLVKFVPVPISL